MTDAEKAAAFRAAITEAIEPVVIKTIDITKQTKL